MENKAATVRLNTYFLGIIASAVLVVSFIYLKAILVPITFAVLLTFLLHPAYAFLVEKKIPRALVLSILLAALFLLLYLLIIMLVSSFAEISDNSAYYSQRFAELIDGLLRPFQLTLAGLLNDLHIGENLDPGEIAKSVFASGILQGVVSSFSSLLTNLIIVLLTWAFMIAGKTAFDDKLRRILGEKGELFVEEFKKIDSQIQIYLVVKTLNGLAMSAVVTIVLSIAGVDFAMLWGILTFLLHFIPNIGSLFATIFPIFFCLIEFGFSGRFIFTVAFLILNQFAFGNVIEPRYLGKHLNLSPVVVLISLFFWGLIWGIPGMFLSVPLVAMMKIIFAHIPGLQQVSALMGHTEK